MSTWLGGSGLSSQFARSYLLLFDWNLRLLCDSWQGSRAGYSRLYLGDSSFSRDCLLALQLGELLVAEVVEVVLPATEEVNRVHVALDCGAHSIN